MCMKEFFPGPAPKVNTACKEGRLSICVVLHVEVLVFKILRSHLSLSFSLSLSHTHTHSPPSLHTYAHTPHQGYVISLIPGCVLNPLIFNALQSMKAQYLMKKAKAK